MSVRAAASATFHRFMRDQKTVDAVVTGRGRGSIRGRPRTSCGSAGEVVSTGRTGNFRTTGVVIRRTGGLPGSALAVVFRSGGGGGRVDCFAGAAAFESREATDLTGDVAGCGLTGTVRRTAVSLALSPRPATGFARGGIASLCATRMEDFETGKLSGVASEVADAVRPAGPSPARSTSKRAARSSRTERAAAIPTSKASRPGGAAILPAPSGRGGVESGSNSAARASEAFDGFRSETRPRLPPTEIPFQPFSVATTASTIRTTAWAASARAFPGRRPDASTAASLRSASASRSRPATANASPAEPLRLPPRPAVPVI